MHKRGKMWSSWIQLAQSPSSNNFEKYFGSKLWKDVFGVEVKDARGSNKAGWIWRMRVVENRQDKWRHLFSQKPLMIKPNNIYMNKLDIVSKYTLSLIINIKESQSWLFLFHGLLPHKQNSLWKDDCDWVVDHLPH